MDPAVSNQSSFNERLMEQLQAAEQNRGFLLAAPLLGISSTQRGSSLTLDVCHYIITRLLSGLLLPWL